MNNFRVLALRVDVRDFDRLDYYCKSLGVKKKELIGGMIREFLDERQYIIDGAKAQQVSVENPVDSADLRTIVSGDDDEVQDDDIQTPPVPHIPHSPHQPPAPVINASIQDIERDAVMMA